MIGTLARHARTHGIAYLALAAACTLGGGVAAAAGTVTTGDIRNDTIRPVDLDFTVGQDSHSTTADREVGTSFARVETVTVAVNDPTEMVAHAVTEIQNSTPSAVTVTLQLVHKDEPQHTRNFTTTVGPESTETILAMFQCNETPPGDNVVILRADASEKGVEITDSILTVIASPGL